jgi:hypothetical protein
VITPPPLNCWDELFLGINCARHAGHDDQPALVAVEIHAVVATGCKQVPGRRRTERLDLLTGAGDRPLRRRRQSEICKRGDVTPTRLHVGAAGTQPQPLLSYGHAGADRGQTPVLIRRGVEHHQASAEALGADRRVDVDHLDALCA